MSLSPIKKIIGQIISVLIIIYLQDLRIDSFHGVLGIHNLSEIGSIVFTVFVVIVITNAYNLIDGVDGLAGGIGVISSLGFGVIAFMMNQIDIAIIAFTLTGSLTGFLRYNSHPARIFMGDTGSLLVGMILSILAINTIKTGLVIDVVKLPNKGPLLAISFLAIPLFDSLRVFVVRVFKGKNPLAPGREHIHHALLDLGFSHRRTTYILCIATIFFLVVSVFLLEKNINIGICILAVIVFLLLYIPFYILKQKTKNE